MTESRLTNHTATARFFTRVLREESHWKLASLEVGSFFHWIDAIPTDLLGFVNRDVATGPVNTRPSDRIWDRRLDPAFWARERPEIVWIDTKTRGDPLGAILEFADAASAGGTTPAMKDFLSLSRHWFWTEPYFDDAAFSAGWLPRMTAVNERWLVLWLVRADVADAVDRDLKAAGFLRKF
jgi:hypothetical protein